MEKIKGYRSIDGGAVIRAKIKLNDIIDVWARALLKADSLEPVHFGKGLLYYAVYPAALKQGAFYYTYRIEILDDRSISLYTVLVDTKGYAKIEVRYGAQRDSYFLQTEYRQLFKYLRWEVLSEQVSRVDLALTLNIKPSAVIKYIQDDRFYSLLSRKTMVRYGDVDSPNSVRFGSMSSVEVAIYDKSREVLEQSFKLSYAPKLEDYMQHFGSSEDVTRIEFRLSRLYLKHIGINTPEEVNQDLAGLWLTMQTKYFVPTEKFNDGKHQVEAASWWDDLPDLILMLRTGTSDNVYSHLYNVQWLKKYEMMFSRVQGYLASIVASMARVPGNLSNSLQVVYRRLIEDSEVVYVRAESRLAIS